MEIQKDIFRDTPVRLLGYMNEVGEAFRYLAKWFVIPSYFISLSYVFADAISKANKQYLYDHGTFSKKTVIELMDVLTWQLIATELIPCFIIHLIVRFSRFTIKRNKVLNGIKNLYQYGPTAIGLISIPIIIRPIDRFVDQLMTQTYRKMFK